MSLINLAGETSLWRGLDLYEKKRVLEWHKVDETVFAGVVDGSGDNRYKVKIDLKHPEKSKCNCRFAESKNRNSLSTEEVRLQLIDALMQLEAEELLEQDTYENM